MQRKFLAVTKRRPSTKPSIMFSKRHTSALYETHERQYSTKFKRQDVLGKKEKSYSIFGPRAIVSLSDDDPKTLDLHLQSLRPFFVKYPPFEKYFKEYIHQNLLEHVIQPINRQITPGLQTNNKYESINNKLKMQYNWKSQKMSFSYISIGKYCFGPVQTFEEKPAFGNYKLFDFLHF